MTDVMTLLKIQGKGMTEFYGNKARCYDSVAKQFEREFRDVGKKKKNPTQLIKEVTEKQQKEGKKCIELL